jgi:hypothetical protein
LGELCFSPLFLSGPVASVGEVYIGEGGGERREKDWNILYLLFWPVFHSNNLNDFCW